MSKLGENLKRILPSSSMSLEKKILRATLLFMICFLFVCVIVGLVVFAITMKGYPVVSVPQLYGLELVDAMEQLQNYGLIAEVHQRTSKENVARGVVFAQHPRAGANIKMGGKVIVTVNRGVADFELPDFTGKHIDEVILTIAELNNSYGNGQEILILNESPIYDVEVKGGIVMAQNPSAHSHIFKPTTIDIQYSLGKWEADRELPQIQGMQYKEAIKMMSDNMIPFHFSVAKNSSSADAGIIIAQSPKAGELIKKNQVVTLQVGRMPNRKDNFFGIFTHKLPRYTIPMEISVYEKTPKGQQELYFKVKHPGGEVTIPYYATEQTAYILMVEDKEVAQFRVH